MDRTPSESISAVQTINSLGNIFRLVIRSWGMTIQPFTRTRFGERHFGMDAGVGWVIMLFYAICTTPPPALLPFNILAYLLPFMFLLHRGSACRRDLRGDAEHSQYTA